MTGIRAPRFRSAIGINAWASCSSSTPDSSPAQRKLIRSSPKSFRTVAKSAKTRAPARVLRQTAEAIRGATFTGKGDREVVIRQLGEFQDMIADGLASWQKKESEGVADDAYGAAVFEMAGACWLMPEFSEQAGDASPDLCERSTRG